MSNLRLWLDTVTETELPTWLEDDDEIASCPLVIAITDTGDTLAIVLME